MEQLYLRPHDVVDKTAQILLKEILTFTQQKGYCSLVLSGGKSPTALYQKLAKLLPATVLARLHLFLLDERYVPVDSLESNAKMVFENFLSPLPQASRPDPQHIHFMQTNLDEKSCAQQYHQEIVNELRNFGPFDLIFMGAGSDGHVASLFPGREKDWPTQEVTAFVTQSPDGLRRISMNYPVILGAKKLFLYVIHERKKTLVEKILAQDSSSSSLPVFQILNNHTQITFIYSYK